MTSLLWALLAVAVAPQDVAIHDGTDLYAKCVNVEKGSPQDMACEEYLSGFSDGLFMGRKVSRAGYGLCAPNDDHPDPEQTRAIVEKYVRDHPESRIQNAPRLILKALLDAYPCPVN
jgi:hypothetical protein